MEEGAEQEGEGKAEAVARLRDLVLCSNKVIDWSCSAMHLPVYHPYKRVRQPDGRPAFPSLPPSLCGVE